MIDLTDLTKVFRGTDAPAVDGLSLGVNEAETVVLVGPSGCGKTTTLKMINRLIEPTSGAITVGGRDVTQMEPHELRRGIGYVIQQIGLFPHRTIRDNIATVPSLLGWGKSQMLTRVDELADMVDIDPDMLDRYPAELSGGQRQRVGVARALAADPPVLLMDEPFGAVDPIVRGRLQHELKDLQARLNKTIVLVTHDIDEAILLGDRIAILNVGGILEQYQTPEETLRSPANGFVANFLGSDRGIKRLSLIPISTAELVPGPVVGPATPIGEVRAVALEHGVDWVAVVDGTTLLGWSAVADLATSGTGERPGGDLRSFATTLSPTDSMKQALDAVVSSQTSVAAIVDGDRYLGMLTMDEISRDIIQ